MILNVTGKENKIKVARINLFTNRKDLLSGNPTYRNLNLFARMSAESEKVIVKPAEHKKPNSALTCIHTAIIYWEQDWRRAWK